MSPTTRAHLLRTARQARSRAYAPYSRFKVGAALLDTRGRVHSGCNVESSTYGATVCAERNAVAAMVRAGGRAVREIVIATARGWLPCGICRQVLAEFAPDPAKVRVHVAGSRGIVGTYTLDTLLPSAFTGKDLAAQ